MSAFWIVSLSSSVIEPNPIPNPANVIWHFTSGVISEKALGLRLTCKTSSSFLIASSLDKPFAESSGLFMIKHCTPSSFAAFIRSASPLDLPLLLRTIILALVSFSWILFIALENGPCIAMICFPVSPLSMHILMLSMLGITLTTNRSFKASFLQKALSSLLPVVRNIVPLVDSSAFSHESTSSKKVQSV